MEALVIRAKCAVCGVETYWDVNLSDKPVCVKCWDLEVESEVIKEEIKCKCAVCGVETEWDVAVDDKPMCKLCKVVMAEGSCDNKWYRKNRVRRLGEMRRYYEAHKGDEVYKDKHAARGRRYYKEHKGEHKAEVAACSRRYYQEHRAEEAARHRRYCEEHKAEVAARHRRYYQEHRAKKVCVRC